MDPAYARAERSVRDLWRETCRCGLIDATPMRPGRGRRSSPPKGRRREGRSGLMRYEEEVFSILAGLRTGSLCPEAARRRVREAGMEEFIRVTLTREETVSIFAYFFGLGYYLWNPVEEPDDFGASILRASFVPRNELT